MKLWLVIYSKEIRVFPSILMLHKICYMCTPLKPLWLVYSSKILNFWREALQTTLGCVCALMHVESLKTSLMYGLNKQCSQFIGQPFPIWKACSIHSWGGLSFSSYLSC